MGNRRIILDNFLLLVICRFGPTKTINSSVTLFMLENLTDELNNALKFSWLSSSGRIIRR